MVGGSKIKIKPEHAVFGIMGRPRIIYKIIKIIQYIVIIILLFYGILYGNSATNFQHGVLNETHDLPCSTFKLCWGHMGVMWHWGMTEA